MFASQRDKSVWEQVRRHSIRTPEAPALIEPGAAEWTFGMLQELVDHLVAVLKNAGFGAEDTIAVLLPDGAGGLVTVLGVSNVCGCAPLNPSLTEVELRFDLMEIGAKAVICLDSYELGLRLGDELGLAVIHVQIKEEGCTWSLAKTARPGAGLSNEGAALLLHTSATTGRRKIVPLSRANIWAVVENSAPVTGITESDRLMLMSRLFHVQGVVTAFVVWAMGGSVIAPKAFETQAFRGWLDYLHPTFYSCGPTQHRAILADLKARPLIVKTTLRFVRSAGNTLVPELRDGLRETLGVPVLDMYGLTETMGLVSTPVNGPWDRGWKTLGAEIAIADPTGTLLSVGDEGEIVVRGPSVMAGYLRDEDGNRQAFWGQGEARWFRTGDSGLLDAEGYLTMSGRLKEIINRGGQKINPTEVDAVLSQHPAVRMVAAFAVPHTALGEDVACAVVLRAGMHATEAELRLFGRRSLARYKIPRRVYFVPEIPHGATGKPQRLVLRERLMTSGVIGASDPANRSHGTDRRLNDIDGALKAIWVRRLGCEHAFRHDDFFQLGGDSLEAESMLAEIEMLLDLRFTDDANERFFESPTLGTLAEMIAMPVATDSRRSQEIGAFPLKGSGSGLDAFLIPADGDEGLYYRLLSRKMGSDRAMWVVRPENSWHVQGLDMLERAAAASVVAIRSVKPMGPYLIGGFCQGGAFAYETARLLRMSGEEVLLLLFDVPAPGEPALLRSLGKYLQHGLKVTQEPGGWRRAARLGRIVLRRALWSGLVTTKEMLGGVAGTPLVEWLRRQAQESYFPIHRVQRSTIPILHFVEARQEGTLRGQATEAWSKMTTGEVRVVKLPGTEKMLFSEANLQGMADSIRKWEVEWMTTRPEQLAARLTTETR